MADSNLTLTLIDDLQRVFSMLEQQLIDGEWKAAKDSAITMIVDLRIIVDSINKGELAAVDQYADLRNPGNLP